MKNVIYTNDAPGIIGPYSQGIKINDMLFMSGQLPINPGTGEIVALDIESQTKQSIQNILAILNAAGGDLNNVVKTTVYLQSMGDFAAMNGIYSDFFKADAPARTCIEVAKIPKNALVEIEAIAII